MTTLCKLTQLAGLAATLALPAVFHAGGAAAQQTVPTKEFKIYNNSLLGPIYPVISTPKQSLDKWLQAFFRVPASGLPTQVYANDDVYRIYVNPTTGGIAPGKYVVLSVPLYSQLLATDEGVVPDEFINWWNGGRVSLYDVAKAIKADQGKDAKNPTTPIAGSPLVTCKVGCNEPLVIYHSAKGMGDLPSNDPAQLTEYTLGGINEAVKPIGWKPQEVDYDVSYVDQVYLPIAMEPVNNPFIGWIGTTQSVGEFKGELENFLNSAEYPGWPTYLDNNAQPILRIPSTATIYASESGASPSPDLSTPGQSFNDTTKYWKSCTAGGGGAECGQVRDVEKMYLANYAAYQRAWIAAQCIGVLPSTPDVEKSLLPHVYGWVPFNETPPPAKCKSPIANAIYDTPGYTQFVQNGKVINKYEATLLEYKQLQYETPDGVFNPYVKLVHFKPYLNMTNAYSFSVDDAVGNMQTAGDGLVIAVGGPTGLPNPAPYDRKKNVQVTVGEPDATLPHWASHGFCTNYPTGPCRVTTPYDGKVLSWNLETVTYPVEVVLLDTAGQEYRFVVTKGPPYAPAPRDNSPITCLTQVTWCSFINAYTDSTNDPLLPVNAVVTRVPVKPN
jgi:hypothetical protein